MKRSHIAIALGVFAGATVLLASCGPVNFLTRTKKVPRRYSVNYDYSDVKAEKSEINKQNWVVYADRDGLSTSAQPGGSLPFRKLERMEPMNVVGKRGDNYKLIKYDPSGKEREFHGWLHRDNLLLFDNSLTDVRNGLKLKHLSAITDSRVMLEAEKYFRSDSLLLFAAPDLKEPCAAIPLGGVLYVLKTADEGSRTLVSQKTGITPDDASTVTSGWVASSLIAPFGSRLTMSAPPRPTASPVSLSPALYAHRVDTTLVFRTLDTSEILDHSDNRVFNVDGSAITWHQSQRIAASLREINVVFAFVPTAGVVSHMPVMAGVIQNLKPVFGTSGNGFNYRFAAVTGRESIDFESDYLSFGDRLIEAGERMDSLKPTGFVDVLRGALALAGDRPDATNIIVVVGETASHREALPRDVVDGFDRCNARLLSYQVFAADDDAYNNFVLQSIDVIESYAERSLTRKRETIVHTDLLRGENRFREGLKNVYALDFPERSMTQGMVIFPEKGKFAGPELLLGGVDSLVRQVEADNIALRDGLDRAFAEVGRHRSRFQPGVAVDLGLDPSTKMVPYVGAAFDRVSPPLVGVTGRVVLPVDPQGLSTAGLLLTETELKDIKEWVAALSSMKPDILGEVTSTGKKARHVRRVRRDLRGVPADIAVVSASETVSEAGGTGDAGRTETGADSLVVSTVPKYASTVKIRQHLRRLYLGELRKCVIEGRRATMSLARAQEYITTLPTVSPDLGVIAIRDLISKSRLADHDLALLIERFEKHKDLLESEVSPVSDLSDSSGEKFFFVPVAAMP
jgi:hypothetical protein